MSKDKSVDPAALPQSEAFNKKNIHQHKHLADTGKPVDENDKLNNELKGKPGNRTSEDEGLNEQSSPPLMGLPGQTSKKLTLN